MLRQFLKYTSSNVLGMLALSCYILADTFFIARGLGAEGITALNLAIPVYSFIHGTGLMLGMGGGTLFSLSKEKDTDKSFTTALILAAMFALLFFIVGLFCATPLAHFLSAKGAVFFMTKTYLQVILLFAPFYLTNNVLLCFVRNDGSPARSMAAMIAGSLSNVALDYIFIFPCGMGIFGAVLATGLAPIISIVVLSPYLIQRKNRFHLRKARLRLLHTKKLLSCGVSALVAEVSSGIVMILFNYLLLKHAGNVGVAAYGVIANLSLVMLAVFTGVAQGAQPLFSNGMRENNRQKLGTFVGYSAATIVAISAILYGIIWFGANEIAAAFNHEQNVLLQRYAVDGLKIYFVGGVFAGLNIILSAYFSAIGVTRPAHRISLLRGLILILPITLLLSALLGTVGIWWSFPATEAIVCLIGLSLYTKHR